MYIREVGPKDYNQTFKAWMDEHANLRDMIAEGRSKLEWERKIPDDKLADLKVMLDSAEFKTNLPKVCIFSAKDNLIDTLHLKKKKSVNSILKRRHMCFRHY